MKRISIFLMASLFVLCAVAQGADKTGMISLKPYIPEDAGLSPKLHKQLMTKMSQIASAAGMAGEGFDNRFIITANIQETELAETATIPVKMAASLAVTFFVGDGIDGTLFSSCTVNVKGIGDNKEDAYYAAIRKISPRKPELLQAVELGKQRIVQYYNSVGPEIINTAKAAAAGGQYDEAISMLFAIPMSSDIYPEAQRLIAEYGAASLEAYNQSLLANAQAAWAASPNEEGAEKAREFISQMQMPSQDILTKTQKLSREIATRLQAVSDREWKLERDIRMAEIKNEHEQNMATIRAAESVAKAYASSRPRVVYHVHWW